MKLKVYLDSAGAEAISLGKPTYPWHYQVRVVDCPTYAEPPENSIFLGLADVDLPSDKQCRELALNMLQNKVKEVRAAAHMEEQALNIRIQNLSALTFDASVKGN